MDNITETKNDPFGDLDVDVENKTVPSFVPHPYPSVVYLHTFLTIVRLLVCLASTIANVFLIYVILKFERLKNRANWYILHYSVCSFGYNIFTPIFDITNEVMLRMPWTYLSGCLVYQFEDTFLLMSFTFAAALTIDWLISVLGIRWHEFFEKVYQHGILSSYITGLLTFIVSTGMCFSETRHYRYYVLSVVYLFFVFIAIFALILKRKMVLTNDQRRNLYSMHVGSLVLICWLPCFLLHYIDNIVAVANTKIKVFLTLLDYIPEFLAFSSPMLVVYFLGRWNKHFKMGYDSVFKMSVRNYENENLDDEESDSENFGNSSTARGNSNLSNGKVEHFTDVSLNTEIDNR